ncbi:MAG: hypothetical protein H6813_07480 [Phycisphaeraceae bacterium]|nr:hypothetical protein [Phycisphaeraceae bacterium]MCB9848336.1 hypothetical protein [Phycisphaeraceae bacterium]
MQATLRLPTTGADGFAGLLDPEGNPASWAVTDRNPIAEGMTAAAWIEGLPGGVTRVLAWSGTLDESLFGAGNPMTWIGPGRAALDGFLAGITPILRERGVRLLIRPHCRHVLGDATTAKSFAQSLAPGSPVGLALEIAGIFEPGMLGAAVDHCRRTFETLGPLAEAVISSGVAVAGDRVIPAPPGEGPVGTGLLEELYESHCRPGTPIVEATGSPEALAGRCSTMG